MRKVTSLIGHITNVLLHQVGLELIRHSYSVSWPSAFSRLRKQGTAIRTIIDVGASDGRWTRSVLSAFPNVSCLLIEAQPVHEPQLRAFKEQLGNVDYVLAAAGDAVGEIYFDASDPSGGLASHQQIENEACIKVPCTTVDAELDKRQLESPFLLKLDTHGFEVPILQGAEKMICDTTLICIETYNFTLCEGCLRFHEMCAFLEQKGFRPISLVNPLFRPKDEVLWQMDLIFARSNRKEFEYCVYR